MVSDLHPETGEMMNLNYHIYDISLAYGKPLVTQKLLDRLKIIQNDIIRARKDVIRPTSYPEEAFGLVLKNMFKVEKVNDVIRDERRRNFGLRFIPVSAPFIAGQNSFLYVWNTPTLNTVDFQLSIEWRGKPQTQGYKLMVCDKRMILPHDWITFPTLIAEGLRDDRKANGRILQCYYDHEWLTYMPSHDKSSWEIGDPDYQHPEKGVGWRKGGWRFVRFRDDVAVPIEASTLTQVQVSITDNIRVEDFQVIFSEDPAKAALRKLEASQEATRRNDDAEKVLAIKRQRRASIVPANIGVCYDFQNKGECRRGSGCNFSHCACDTTYVYEDVVVVKSILIILYRCMCTVEVNTFGQRPLKNLEEEGEEPSTVDSTNQQGLCLYTSSTLLVNIL